MAGGFCGCKRLFPVAALLAVGCSKSLFESSGTSVAPSAGPSEWSKADEAHAYCPSVSAIACCPQVANAAGACAPCFVTANVPLHPIDMRVCGPGPVGGYIKIWAHPSYGFELYSTFVDHGAHDVRFTADGSAVVFTCRAGLLAWYLDDRRIETRLAATDSTRLSISEDGRWAAEQTVDEVPIRIRIFDLETAAERLTLEVSHKLPSSYFFFHFSKDGNRLVGVRRGSGDKPATATIWDLLTVREERSFAIDPYSVRSALSPDGNYLAAEYSADSIVQIWNTSNGELICTAGKQVDIRCLAYSPDGRILATGGEGTKNKKRAGEIKIWDATNGDELATIYDENSWGVTAMAFSPDGRTLASGNGDGMVVFWKVPEHLVTANVQQ